jgi:hypothetical protein
LPGSINAVLMPCATILRAALAFALASFSLSRVIAVPTKRRKLSRSRMVRRLSSGGLMIDGSVLAAMSLMKSIVKMTF